MNNSWKKSLFLLLILAAGGFYAYKVEYVGKQAKDEAEKKWRRIFSFDSKAVGKISMTSQSGRVEMVKEKDDWKITSPVEAKGDKASITLLIEAVLGAETAESSDGNPQEFGLEPPFLKLDFFHDGKTDSLLMGQKSPTGASVYIKTAASPKILLADAGLSNALSKTLFQLRDKRLLELTPDEVGKVEVATDKLSLTAEKQADGKWRLLAPLKALADERMVKDLITGYAYASAIEFADATTEAEAGLQKPSAKITFWNKGGKQTLYLGGETNGKTGLYAKSDGGRSIAVLASNMASRLPKSADELRDKKVFVLDGKEINAITIKTPGKELELVKNEKAVWGTVKGAPSVETEKAGKLAFALASAEAVEFLGEKDFKAKAKGASNLITVKTTAGTQSISVYQEGETFLGADEKESRYFSFKADDLAEHLK